MSLMSFRIDSRFVVRLGTCSTLLNVKEGLKESVPWPAIEVTDPSATVIPLLS